MHAPPPSSALRLPRLLESEPGAAGLVAAIAKHGEPLWAGSQVSVPRSEMTPALATALREAFSNQRLVRGLENAERVLAAEEQGLQRVDRMTGVARGGRVSRLVVMADDGAERFYRRVESIVRRHAPRVLGVRLTVSEGELGALLFGSGQVARLLMVEHKQAVATVLLALASHWRGEVR